MFYFVLFLNMRKHIYPTGNICLSRRPFHTLPQISPHVSGGGGGVYKFTVRQSIRKQRCSFFFRHRVVTIYCGVMQSGRLCLNSLALCWTRGISLRGTAPQGVALYGLSAERATTWFIFKREPLQSVCHPGGTVRVGQSPEINLASRSRSSFAQTRV